MDASTLLQRVRRRQGLSQAELARRAGTSQPVVSAYENGHRDPATATLRRLVAAGGERLVLGLGEPAPDLPPATTPDEHAARLLDVLLLADAIPHRIRPVEPMPRMVSRS